MGASRAPQSDLTRRQIPDEIKQGRLHDILSVNTLTCIARVSYFQPGLPSSWLPHRFSLPQPTLLASLTPMSAVASVSAVPSSTTLWATRMLHLPPSPSSAYLL